MEEKKARIVIEYVGDGLMQFAMEGNRLECVNLIAQHMVTEPAFMEAVDMAVRTIMAMGVELLARQREKDMGDGD
jgi:hypothetical protein